MKINEHNKNLIFVHIPKAGGSTLHSIIERQYKKKVNYRYDMQFPETFQRFETLSQSEKDSLRCIRGHMPFGLHHRLKQDFTYTTVVRDPLKRFISKYHNVLRRPDLAEAINIPASRTKTFDDFIELQIERVAMNFQTRMIGGYLNLERPVSPFEPLPADALEKAKHNIEKYFLVAGTINRFDEYLILLGKLLGWQKPLHYAKQNVNFQQEIKDRQPSKLNRERIYELNALDVELCKFVSARFEQQLQQFDSPEFQSELQYLQHKCSKIGWIQAAYNRPIVRKLRKFARRMITACS